MTTSSANRATARHLRRWTLRLLLLAAGFSVAVATAELAIRVTNAEPPPMWKFDSAIGWTYSPNLRTWYVTPEFKSWVHINSNGLHDVERAYAKPPGSLRLLMLGDSFTAALEVPYEASYARRLERELRSHVAPLTPEVINGGVGGFATVNELLFYRQEGVRYRPDLVILTLSDGDIRDNDPAIAETVVPGAPYFELRDGALGLHHFPLSPWTTVERQIGRLRLARLGHRVLTSVKSISFNPPAGETATSTPAGRIPPMSALYHEPRAPEWSRALDMTKALIGALHREVAGNGGRLVVVALIPLQATRLRSTEDVAVLSSGPEAELSAFFESQGIPHVWPARELFGRERKGEVVRFPRDQHLTERGHELMAGILVDFLLRQNLVSQSRGGRASSAQTAGAGGR